MTIYWTYIYLFFLLLFTSVPSFNISCGLPRTTQIIHNSSLRARMWLKPPEGRDHPQTPGGQILMSCQCWTHQRGEGLMRRIMSPPEDIYRSLVPITLLLVSQVHQKWEASSVQWYRKVSSHVWMNEGNMVKSRTFREGKRAIRHKDCCLLRRYLGCRGNTVQYCVAVKAFLVWIGIFFTFAPVLSAWQWSLAHLSTVGTLSPPVSVHWQWFCFPLWEHPTLLPAGAGRVWLCLFSLPPLRGGCSRKCLWLILTSGICSSPGLSSCGLWSMSSTIPAGAHKETVENHARVGISREK